MNKIFEATDDLNELIGKYGYGIVKSAFSKIQEKEDAEIGKADFAMLCRPYGLKPEHYGLVFRVNGEAFKVKSIKPSNRKYPVLADRVRDGRGFKFSPDQILFSFEAKSIKQIILVTKKFINSRIGKRK